MVVSTLFFFETRLELTPSGKIRVEESENKRVYTLSNNHSCLLPLRGIKFISLTPKRKEKLSLYSRDRTKSKVAKIKPEQLELPLTETGIILQEASFRSGDKRVKSLQELYVGKGEIHSINWGVVEIQKALIELAKELNCSVIEWEAIAQMSLVFNANQLLNFIQEIPNMRKISGFSKFQEPTTIKTHSKTEQHQTQKVK